LATNLLLPPEIEQAYDRRLLQRFRTNTVFNRFGRKKSIPKGGGVNMSFRRMEIIRPVAVASSTWPADATYTAATGALLTEGTFHTPAVVASWYEVTATVRQYGQAAYVSDLNLEQALDPQLSEYVDNFSESMTELLDLVTRDVLLTNTNIQYANGRASASAIVSGDFLNLSELRKAKRTLKDANAKPAEDGKFVVIGHPDTSYDLEGDSNITNVWVQGGGLGKADEYWKTTIRDLPLGFRYYESTIVPISRASGYGDVYNTFVLGEEAYGQVKLESLPAKIITHLPGTSGVSDPLDQVGTIGWKANMAAVLLNSKNIVTIKHQTSAFTGTRAGL
jgi:N4-gp56 family major capsid protein